MKRDGLITQIQAVIFDNLFKKIKADKHQALEIEIINSVVTKEDDIVDDFSSDDVDKVASARSSKELYNTTLKTGRFQTTTDWLNRSDIPEGDYDVTFQNAGQNMFGYNHFKFSVRYLNLGTEYIHTLEMLDGRKFRRAYALNGYPDFEEVISSGGSGSVSPTVEASYLSDFTDIYSIGVYTIVGAIQGFYIAGFEYPNLKQMVIWSNKVFTREIDVTAEVIIFPDFVEGDKNKADYSGQNVYQNVGGIESNTPADVLLAKYAGVSTFSNFSDKAGADEDDNNIKLTYARKDEITGKENIGVAAGLISVLKDGVGSTGDTLQKLYNLILGVTEQQIVPNIAARDAFNIPRLPYSLFVTDDGDGKWAVYQAITTGVGANFVKTSDPDLLNAVMSAVQIKTAYESNSDTNALTNALLAKLNSLTALTSDQLKILNTIPLICSDETTDITASATVRKNRYVFQTAQSFTNIIGELIVAAAGGKFTVDVKKNNVSVFSTVLTFNSGASTTRTATVPAVLTSTPISFAIGDYVEVFVTGIGSITAGQGLIIYLM